MTFSCKCVLQACKILLDDSVDLLTNILYNKETCPLGCKYFYVFFYKVERGGSFRLLHCLLRIKLLKCKYLKKCLKKIAHLDLSSNDMRTESHYIGSILIFTIYIVTLHNIMFSYLVQLCLSFLHSFFSRNNLEGTNLFITA